MLHCWYLYDVLVPVNTLMRLLASQQRLLQKPEAYTVHAC